MSKFIILFLSLIKKGDDVLDLGAGDGKYSVLIAKKGTHIFAVDKQTPIKDIAGVTWKTMSIEDWLKALKPRDKFDAILGKNILQFFEAYFVMKELFPKLSAHLNPGGIIALETFYRAPEPPFGKPHRSYWTDKDLRKIFPKWTIVFKESVEEWGRDMEGKKRIFFLTRFILKKPK